MAILFGSSPPVRTGGYLRQWSSAWPPSSRSECPSYRLTVGWFRARPPATWPAARSVCRRPVRSRAAALGRAGARSAARPAGAGLVEADLGDLAVYEALLAHRGVRGLVVCCDDCAGSYTTGICCAPTYFNPTGGWDGAPAQPTYDPEPDAYVTWDSRLCRRLAEQATSDYDNYR